MVEISDNPPSEADKDLYMSNFSLIDARHRFIDKYASRDGYPGYALGANGIRVPVSLFLSDDGLPLPLDKNMLVKVIKLLRQLYTEQKAMPSQISFMPQGAEIFGVGLKAALENNL
jgi:hypothetical protein